MPKRHFDFESFHAALDSVRKERRMTWRQVAAKAGVSPSALTRLAHGSKPDVDTIAYLADWAGLDVARFFGATKSGASTDTMAEVAALLRADPKLDKESAARLQELVRLTYQIATEDGR